MTLCVYDTETTGFTRNHVVELAAVIVSPTGEVFTWYERCCPQSPIEDGAASIHGITDADVENCRPDTEVVAEFWQDIHGLAEQWSTPLVLAGHNINSYDNRVLRPYIGEFPHIPTVDTLRLARLYYPDAPDHKLTTMHSYLGCSGDYKAHSALDDCWMSLDILRKFMESAHMTYQELSVALRNPVKLTTMPNGKHKGRPINVIPTSYMEYMVGLSDMDPDIKYTFDVELTKRTV